MSVIFKLNTPTYIYINNYRYCFRYLLDTLSQVVIDEQEYNSCYLKTMTKSTSQTGRNPLTIFWHFGIMAYCDTFPATLIRFKDIL